MKRCGNIIDGVDLPALLPGGGTIIWNGAIVRKLRCWCRLFERTINLSSMKSHVLRGGVVLAVMTEERGVKLTLDSMRVVMLMNGIVEMMDGRGVVGRCALVASQVVKQIIKGKERSAKSVNVSPGFEAECHSGTLW